jgi:HSP20 family molecular chaperone IbpA
MRAIARVLLVSALVILVAFVVFSYSTGTANWRYPRESTRPVGTTGTIDTEKARERGAELGEKAAKAANKVEQTVSEAGITAKIKAKMALDDFVKARAIDVSTTGSVVTLSGRVQSQTEHDRANTLARETAGVTQVIDHIVVQPDRS